VGPPPLTRRGDWLAAVLACGPSAALSHRSAAQLWALRPFQAGPIDVSVTTAGGRRRPAIRVHRTTSLPRVTLDHVPVTTVSRTLLDLAAVVSATELRRAIDEADRVDKLCLAELTAAVEARRGHRGNAALREILADYTGAAPTRSELEAIFLDLLRAHGLPLPEVNAGGATARPRPRSGVAPCGRLAAPVLLASGGDPARARCRNRGGGAEPAG